MAAVGAAFGRPGTVAHGPPYPDREEIYGRFGRTPCTPRYRHRYFTLPLTSFLTSWPVTQSPSHSVMMQPPMSPLWVACPDPVERERPNPLTHNVTHSVTQHPTAHTSAPVLTPSSIYKYHDDTPSLWVAFLPISINMLLFLSCILTQQNISSFALNRAFPFFLCCY